jgi:hypothetical protein
VSFPADPADGVCEYVRTRRGLDQIHIHVVENDKIKVDQNLGIWTYELVADLPDVGATKLRQANIGQAWNSH